MEGAERRQRAVPSAAAGILAVIIVLCCAVAARADMRIVRLSDGRDVKFAEMADDLARATVVFVGELHTSKEHHDLQLALIRALAAAGGSVAVGLEMFAAADQASLDGWVSGGMKENEFIQRYYKNWTIGWPQYSEIFSYARSSRTPLVGLNISRDIARKVSSGGFSSLGKDDLAQLPPGVSCDVDGRYREYIRRNHRDHSLNDKGFEYFCEAQILWDKSMAWHLASYLKRNPVGRIVVLAGAGHAMKWGIPEQLQRFHGVSYRVVLPSGSTETPPTREEADYIVYLR